MIIQRGKHLLRHGSTLQSTTALSSAEAEYYALTKGAAYALGIQSMFRDWGLELGLAVVWSDSSSGLSFASRRGLGRMRHIETRYLWLQDRVAKGDMRVHKIEGTKKVSDVLTKVTNGVLLAKHMATMGYVDIANSKLQKTTV